MRYGEVRLQLFDGTDVFALAEEMEPADCDYIRGLMGNEAYAVALGEPSAPPVLEVFEWPEGVEVLSR